MLKKQASVDFNVALLATRYISQQRLASACHAYFSVRSQLPTIRRQLQLGCLLCCVAADAGPTLTSQRYRWAALTAVHRHHLIGTLVLR